MSANIDTFDQREPLGKPFVGSLALHITLAAAAVGYALAGIASKGPMMGDPGGGGAGAVTVSVVPVINLPGRTGITNPVANDTTNLAPPAPAPKKAQPKAKPKEVEKAIPIKDSKSPKKTTYRDSYEAPLTNYHPTQPLAPNQVTGTTGQAVSTPMIAKLGSGGIGIGNSSPFGQVFGWYAKRIQDEVALHWNTSDVNARLQTAPEVVVTFTILRNGKVAPGSVKVLQASGVAPLDFSAQRAILDSSFDQLPQGFQKSQADIELHFQLRR